MNFHQLIKSKSSGKKRRRSSSSKSKKSSKPSKRHRQPSMSKKHHMKRRKSRKSKKGSKTYKKQKGGVGFTPDVTSCKIGGLPEIKPTSDCPPGVGPGSASFAKALYGK